jgi:iron complex outermembrane receptor protein
MKKHYLRKTAIACSLATTWAVVPTLAVAQDESFALEEVIVTARKREESLQDVAVSVTALTEQLNRSSVQSLQDIQSYVPNVTIELIPGNNGASISIRGISFQETDKSLDPPAGVVLDGVYLGVAAGQLLNNFDLERVEVLRGPQGTLFGKNTIAGAVNVIRTAPTKEWGVKAKVGAGDWDKQEISAIINTPLTERGGIKLYANSVEHDGYIENNIIGDDMGSVDYQQVGATVAFDITDNFDLSFTAERIEDDSDVGAWANFNTTSVLACLSTLGIAGIPVADAPPGSGCMDFDDESGEDNSSQNAANSSSVTNDFYNLTMNWMLGDWQLTSITGYVDRDEEFSLEYDASRVPFLTVLANQQYSQTSQEFRINGNINDNINLTAGLYYWDSDWEQFQESYDMWYFFGIGFGPEGGLNPGDVSQTLTGKGDNQAYSAFASIDWALSEKWVLNLGGRYTYEEKSFTGQSGSFIYQPTGDEIVPEGPTVTLDDDWSEFSPRIALQYDMNEDIMLFGSYSNGFKSGGYFARTQDIYGLNSYDPEYVDTFELGMKSEWWDNRARFNATAFYSDYSDKQEDVIVPAADGSVGTIVTNASDVEMYGLELEFTALLTQRLSMFMNLGLLNAEYNDFDADISGDGIVTDNSGLTLRNAPETTFGLGLDWVQPLAGGELGVHYNYLWRDEFQTIFQNDPLGKVESAGFHNASMDFSFMDHYQISVYGRNLSDERYARVILIPPVSNFGQYNPPRHYGVELTLNF